MYTKNQKQEHHYWKNEKFVADKRKSEVMQLTVIAVSGAQQYKIWEWNIKRLYVKQ